MSQGAGGSKSESEADDVRISCIDVDTTTGLQNVSVWQQHSKPWTALFHSLYEPEGAQNFEPYKH